MGFKLAVLSFAVLSMTGCGKSLEDLVRMNKPGAALVQLEAPSVIKISPGNTIATGTDVSMTAHVTITDRPLTGSDVSAKVSVSRHRNADTNTTQSH